MKIITIELTDFQYALLAHRTADPKLFAKNKLTNEIDHYQGDLSRKIIDHRMRKGGDPIPANAEQLIQEMFNADGYMTASEVEATKKAAEQPIPNFKDRIV